MELSAYLETSISCPEPAGSGQQQQTMLGIFISAASSYHALLIALRFFGQLPQYPSCVLRTNLHDHMRHHLWSQYEGACTGAPIFVGCLIWFWPASSIFHRECLSRLLPVQTNVWHYYLGIWRAHGIRGNS